MHTTFILIIFSLQIFFNLQSLPEVVLLAVDTNIKKALELSTNIINVDKISKLTSDKTGNVIGQQSKKASIESSNQTKVAVMEIAHSWASSIYELALQILVLQKVLSKKEDPISHKRFADVLAISIPSSTSNSNADKSRSTSANLYLFSNNLVTLFWERLAVSMHDVLITKLKQHTSASILLYPHLTKFGTEANESLEVSS